MSYSKTHLPSVEDSAPRFGLGDFHEARFAREPLGAEHTGLAHYRLKPGKRQPFAHRHDHAEEIYLVLAGGGTVTIDDELVDLGAMDAVRVSPRAVRRFEAGPDGMEFLAFGPHHEGDGEMLKDDPKD